jgi:hypothetical protein
MPLRVRAEPPTARCPRCFDPAKLVTRFDSFQFAMCSRMYFQPHPLERLVEVRYRFAAAQLQEAAEQFREALIDVERQRLRSGQRIYSPLSLIAPSVQF